MDDLHVGDTLRSPGLFGWQDVRDLAAAVGFAYLAHQALVVAPITAVYCERGEAPAIVEQFEQAPTLAKPFLVGAPIVASFYIP